MQRIELRGVFGPLAVLALLVWMPVAVASDAVSSPPIIQGSVKGMAFDPSGNRYVTGTFSGSADFNPAVGEDLKTAAGGIDTFVTRFNADGSYAWTQTFGGAQTEAPESIVATASEIYVCGSFDSNAAKVGGAGADIMSAGLFDAFVLALDPATGAALTAFSGDGVQTFGGPGLDYGLDVAFSGPTVYLAGAFFSISNVGIGGSGSLANTDATGNTSDGFVAALRSANGAADSTFSTDGIQIILGSSTSNQEATAVTFANNHVYVGGHFDGTNLGVGVFGGLSARGMTDGFVTALTVDGNKDNAFSGDGIQTFNGTNIEKVEALAATSTRVYAVGHFDSSDLQIGGTGSNASTLGNSDSFVIALETSTGNAVTAFSSEGIQTIGGSAASDEAARVVVDNGVVYVAGRYASDSGGIGGGGTAAAAGSDDAFVAAISESTGAAVTAFSNDGIQFFGGTNSDEGTGLAARSATIFLAGSSTSTDAGVGGVGSLDSTGFGGFLLPLAQFNGLQEDSFEANNSFILSNPVFQPNTSRALFGNDDDHFIFTTIGGGPTTITLTHNVAATGATVQLLDSDGILRSNPTSIGGTTKTIALNPLAKGTYGIRVFLAGTQQNAYTLALDINGIEVTSPSGGLSPFTGGSVIPVTWDVIGNVSTVDIQISIDGGTSFTTLVTSTPNDGSETVMLPNVSSSQCVIAVLVQESTYGDDSSGFFTINASAVAETLTVITPNTVADFLAGAPLDVAWSSTGAIGNVDIEISVDDRVTFTPLVINTPDDGSERITLPTTPSLQCFIRVKGTGDGSPADLSDVPFHIVAVVPPVVTGITVSQNPSRTNASVTFTALATDPLGGALVIVWEFGDGGASATGNPVQRVFTVPGAYTVTATVSNATGSATATLQLPVVGPSSGGAGVPGIAVDDPPVANPLNGLSVSVASSDGGVVELSVSIDALIRDAFDVETEFTDLPGRGGVVAGTRPVHKFEESGIWISKSSALESTTKEVKGKIRKTLPISRRETGQPALVAAAPASAKITKPTMKGRFLFTEERPDEVTFGGAFELPAGMDLVDPQPWTVSIGNIVDDVMIDPKGKPMSKGNVGRIKKMKVSYPRPKKGETATKAGQMAKVSLTLSLTGMSAAGFDTEGIANSVRTAEAGMKSVPRQIQVAFMVAGVAYEGLVNVQFALAKDAESGSMLGRGGK